MLPPLHNGACAIVEAVSRITSMEHHVCNNCTIKAKCKIERVDQVQVGLERHEAFYCNQQTAS